MGSAGDAAAITRRTIAQNTVRRPSRSRQKISHPALAVIKSNGRDPLIIANQKTSLSLWIPGLAGETACE